jgi:formylglycine-generating enzyme
VSYYRDYCNTTARDTLGFPLFARFARSIDSLTIVALSALIAAFAPAARGDVFHMPAGQAGLEFVTVGDVGNARDSTGYGAVNYAYGIGKYLVTNAQYVQFLNAVATSADPYGLYSKYMATDLATVGIRRSSGAPGSFTYTVIGDGNIPVYFVNWGDAARFCNWLQNGQPIGSEGSLTTETGAYSLNGALIGSELMAVVRNANARYFIPSENEWYKAAYYKGGGIHSGYWLYPTQSNTQPSNILSSTGTNNANWGLNFLTPVGAFAASPGPYGTFDQGGDLRQWNEANLLTTRGERGADWGDLGGNFDMKSTTRDTGWVPTTENQIIGFRIATVPEPGGALLLGVGALLLLMRRTCHCCRRRIVFLGGRHWRTVEA